MALSDCRGKVRIARTRPSERFSWVIRIGDKRIQIQSGELGVLRKRDLRNRTNFRRIVDGIDKEAPRPFPGPFQRILVQHRRHHPIIDRIFRQIGFGEHLPDLLLQALDHLRFGERGIGAVEHGVCDLLKRIRIVRALPLEQRTKQLHHGPIFRRPERKGVDLLLLRVDQKRGCLGPRSKKISIGGPGAPPVLGILQQPGKIRPEGLRSFGGNRLRAGSGHFRGIHLRRIIKLEMVRQSISVRVHRASHDQTGRQAIYRASVRRSEQVRCGGRRVDVERDFRPWPPGKSIVRANANEVGLPLLQFPPPVFHLRIGGSDGTRSPHFRACATCLFSHLDLELGLRIPLRIAVFPYKKRSLRSAVYSLNSKVRDLRGATGDSGGDPHRGIQVGREGKHVPVSGHEPDAILPDFRRNDTPLKQPAVLRSFIENQGAGAPLLSQPERHAGIIHGVGAPVGARQRHPYRVLDDQLFPDRLRSLFVRPERQRLHGGLSGHARIRRRAPVRGKHLPISRTVLPVVNAHARVRHVFTPPYLLGGYILIGHVAHTGESVFEDVGTRYARSGLLKAEHARKLVIVNGASDDPGRGGRAAYAVPIPHDERF